MSVIRLLTDVTTAVPTYGPVFVNNSNTFTVDVSEAGTGAVTATVIVQGCNDEASWKTFSTFSLSGTTTALDGASYVQPWKFIRAGVTAISGTGATVQAYLNAN